MKILIVVAGGLQPRQPMCKPPATTIRIFMGRFQRPQFGQDQNPELRYNQFMSRAPLGEVSWERMIRAVEKVRERLLRATAALDKAGVPYAVVGRNAGAARVSRIDEAAVRNTQDVDL